MLRTEQFNTIQNSQFWRITKPFRVILDCVKRVCRKIWILRKAAKFFRCWKENGFRYTMRRVKAKLAMKKAAKKPLYAPAELEAQKKVVFPKKIKFSILVPLYNTPKNFLEEMINSVKAQTYSNWELCLADGSEGKDIDLEKEVKRIAGGDKRIRYRRLPKNYGISGCSILGDGNISIILDVGNLYASANH